MRVVTVVQVFPGTVHEAESVWYDTERWPSFVDGLARVERVGAGWPAAGAELTWRSVPAGRGHVTERVIGHEPLEGQTLEIEDDSITGKQWVSFIPDDGNVIVRLTLEYRLKGSSLFTPVVDLLFIRSAIRRSLESTLRRFGAELDSARAHDVG